MSPAMIAVCSQHEPPATVASPAAIRTTPVEHIPTTELRKAIQMLFSAQLDGDHFRIHAALCHLEFLEMMAVLRTSEDPQSEPQDIVRLMDFMESGYEDAGNEPEPDGELADA